MPRPYQLKASFRTQTHKQSAFVVYLRAKAKTTTRVEFRLLGTRPTPKVVKRLVAGRWVSFRLPIKAATGKRISTCRLPARISMRVRGAQVGLVTVAKRRCAPVGDSSSQADLVPSLTRVASNEERATEGGASTSTTTIPHADPLSNPRDAVVEDLPSVEHWPPSPEPQAPMPPPSDGGTPTYSPEPAADRVGISSKMVWTNEQAAETEMQRLRAAGVRWIREDLPWRLLEPADDVFTWKAGDALMAAASRSRMNVLGILTYSPPWASSDPTGAGNKNYPPKEFDQYRKFAAEVVARYGAAGSFWDSRPDLSYRPLRAVELWNEPYIHHSWLPNPDPAAYGEMASRAARAIRIAAPEIAILVPGDVHQHRSDFTVRAWLEPMLQSTPGLAALVDGWSVHPYPGEKRDGPYVTSADPRWDYGRVPEVGRVAARYNAKRPLWITEIGWNTDTKPTEAVTEAVQAAHVLGAVDRALVEWGGEVARTFVYSWGTEGWSLKRPDGSVKPAFEQLSALLLRLRASGR